MPRDSIAGFFLLLLNAALFVSNKRLVLQYDCINRRLNNKNK